MTDKRDRLEKWLLTSLEKYFLPLLLGGVVMNVIFHTYYSFNIKLYTAAFVLFEAGLFRFFEKIKKKKILRFFIYCGISALVLVLSGWLIGSGWQSSGVSFYEWFYLTGSRQCRRIRRIYFSGAGLFPDIRALLFHGLQVQDIRRDAGDDVPVRYLRQAF